MNISNKALLILFVTAVLVTILGSVISVSSINKASKLSLGRLMTGRGTSGYVNVTIIGSSVLNVTATECDFGSGAVNASYTYAIVASNGTITNWNGTGTSTNMSIQNDGNSNLSVTMTAGKNAVSFLGGGTRIAYNVFAGNKDGVACTGLPNVVQYYSMIYNGSTGYNGTAANATSVTICSNFSSSDPDEMWVGCYLEIADNTPPGTKTDTWTFTGSVF